VDDGENLKFNVPKRSGFGKQNRSNNPFFHRLPTDPPMRFSGVGGGKRGGVSRKKKFSTTLQHRRGVYALCV